jgi:hypothetical protein
MKPVKQINHDPHQQYPKSHKLHMRDIYYRHATEHALEYYAKEVASKKRRNAAVLKKFPQAIYIKPPKGMIVWNEDWECPYQVEYRGYLYEITQGHEMVIHVDKDGYRTVIGSFYENLEAGLNAIDVLIQFGPSA